MVKMRSVLKWIGNILIIILLAILLLSGLSMIRTRSNPSKITNVLGFTPMSVLSGSMRPMLQPGDMIITRRPIAEDIKIGDVITYRVGSDTLVTHRVIDIINENNELKFQTQGDANNTSDRGLISAQEIVGTYVFKISKGGYIANFTRSPLGFILIIILPLTLLIGNELRNVWMEEKKEANI